MGEEHGEDQLLQRVFQRVAPYADSVLDTLQSQIGLSTWMFSHRSVDGWVVVSKRHSAHAAPGHRDDPGVAGWCAALCESVGDGQPVILPRTSPRDHAPAGVQAVAALPIMMDAGQVIAAVSGTDSTAQQDGLRGRIHDLRLVGRLFGALVAAEIRAVAAADEAQAARAIALRDPLTGLGNRRAWDRVLATEQERCRRHGNPAAVVVVDLDNLKEVNDRQGHAAGDALLRQAGAALESHTRLPDRLARIGGDEFAMVATDCGPEAVEALVERLRVTLSKASVIASVGAAANSDLTEAWREADRAMYADKRRRRR